MGILDYVTKVLVRYEADISQMKAGLRELSAEEKKLAEQQIATAEARNASLEQQKSGLENLALAAGGAFVAFEIAKSSVQETIKFQQEQAASLGFDIEALKDAAGGLKDDMDLMTFAAQTSRGAFKLNQEQMELFQEAMRGYAKDGFDAKEVTDRFTEALISGRTRGLKEFGIQLDDTKDKQKLLRELTGLASAEVEKYGGNLEGAGDDMRRMSVQWTEGLEKIKIAIGELVMQFAPLIESVADLGSHIGSVIGGIKSAWGLTPFGMIANARADHYATALANNDQTMMAWKLWGNSGWERDDRGHWQRFDDSIAGKVTADADALEGNGEAGIGYSQEADPRAVIRSAQHTRALMTALAKKVQRAYDEAYGIVRGSGGGDRGVVAPGATSVEADLAPSAVASLSLGSAVPGADLGGSELAASMAMIQRGLQEEGSRSARYAAFTHGKSESWAEQHFGKLEDFDAYAAGFKLLEGAATSAFNAWINGSESLGTAIRKAIGSALAGLAVQLGVEALKEGAYAVASLAFGDFAGAAAHGEAAALFAAGAAAAGAGAHELAAGSGAAPAKGAASLGPSLSGRGSSAPGGGSNVTIVLGDEFAPASPHQLATRAFDALQRAKKVGGDAGGVIWG